MARYKKLTALEKAPIKVTLSCGHSVRVRIHPLNPLTKMGCLQGLGCGYNLDWVSWVDLLCPTREGTNPRMTKEE